MKTPWLGLSLFLLTAPTLSRAAQLSLTPESLPGQAGNSQLLLTRQVSAGFIAPAYATSSECEIYNDKVVLIQRVGILESRAEKKVALSGDIASLITTASQGKLTNVPAPSDGGVTRYLGYSLLFPDSQLHEVELGSVGSRHIINDSPAAHTLILFIDMNCKA